MSFQPLTGFKKDVWYAIDPLTGNKLQTLTMDASNNVCPSPSGSTIFIGRTGRFNFLFSHPPKRRRVTYASTIRPASASTLSTSSMKPLHGIISYCTCILV